MKSLASSVVLALALFAPAQAQLVITEVMPQSGHTASSASGDWWELTNTGSVAVNLAGYRWDDVPTPSAPTVSNFPNVTIAAGESIIILQANATNATAWKTSWGLTQTRVLNRDQFAAMGGEGFSGLGVAGDEINLYDPSGAVVAHVEFGPAVTGFSKAFHRDGRVVHGVQSAVGLHGAAASADATPDVGSPGDEGDHFVSAPVVHARGSYRYEVVADGPSGAPAISATGLPGFLALAPGPAGRAVLASTRPLTLADAGSHLVRLAAGDTLQEFLLTVLNPSPSIVLNEYNAVGAANFLNGGTALSDDDGGALSADDTFGRIAGNGGQWVEFVVLGNGGSGVLDLRGWKVQIGTDQGSGFVARNTLTLSGHNDWRAVPAGTILTFIDRTSAQGGRDSGFAIRDRRGTVGDLWSNVWMGDSARLVLTSQAADGYGVSAGWVFGIVIDNAATQFRVLDAAGRVVFGPAGEGVAPSEGTNSREVFELEGHPSPFLSPVDLSTATRTGYDDGASESTFGWPNRWIEAGSVVTQRFDNLAGRLPAAVLVGVPGAIRVRLAAPGRGVFRLESSTDLSTWRARGEIAIESAGTIEFPDLEPASKRVFYRVVED